MKLRLRLILFCAASAALFAADSGTPATLNGWVLDSACAYTRALTKPISPECAVQCARKGSPLVLMTDDGKIYLPVADSMPAQGQNARLMPFAGKRVTVSGNVYERSGSRAIVIAKIQAAP